MLPVPTGATREMQEHAAPAEELLQREGAFAFGRDAFLMRREKFFQNTSFFAERYARKCVNEKLCKIYVDKGFSG